MAVTFMCGFEAQQAATDNVTLTGTASYSTAQARTGAASLRCNPASGAAGSAAFGAALNGWLHFGLYIAALPVGASRTIAKSANLNLLLRTDGKLQVGTTGTTVLTTGRWYWIGLRGEAGSFTGVLLQVDGVDEISGTVSPSGTGHTIGDSTAVAATMDVYFDDVIVDNAGFLAPSKVDIALPISDAGRLGFTGGAGGTTNLWDALNNTPPAGVASGTETNTSNIVSPASVTCDYNANLETYSTLGIVSGDTVLAVRTIVRHGEDIATGTKNFQNMGELTNPTIAGVAVTAGNDAGAHGAEVGLWLTTFGTLTTSPSVTLGTSPVLRVSRSTESRVACIDFMGLLVAWTPAAAAPASDDVPRRVTGMRQAVHRAAAWFRRHDGLTLPRVA